MKAKTILEAVIYLGETEQQGTTTTDERGGVAFARDFFGGDALVTGWIKPETLYFYTYGEQLKGVADAIIKVNGERVFLYEIE